MPTVVLSPKPWSTVARALMRQLRTNLLGLGVGTLVTYGRAGDHYRVYELNPAVLDLARRRFSYLSDSAAEIVTPLGVQPVC